MRAFVVFSCVVLMFAVAPAANGQAWDSTGNQLLQGTYNFREIRWVTPDGTTLKSAESRFGTIVFDGAGNYSISGTTNTGSPYLVATASYSISAGGFGFLDPPSGGSVRDRVYGSTVAGIFIGSSTESGINNLFIAARQSATPVTTETFNQPYTLVYTNQPTTNFDNLSTNSFSISPNGQGLLILSFPINNVTPSAGYSFSGGVGTLDFSTVPSTPSCGTCTISGTEQLYVANGGLFVFGGSATGADMLVGIRQPTRSPDLTFSGLYFQAGIQAVGDYLTANHADSFFGAINAVPAGIVEDYDDNGHPYRNREYDILAHWRRQNTPDPAYDYTLSIRARSSLDTAPSNIGGGTFAIDYSLSDDGNVMIGRGALVGYMGLTGLNVGLKAPALSGPGVFLNPNGVVNAASYSPFTARISPGELLTLFGTNLALSGTSLQDNNFPSSLGGVSVMINGLVAPIYAARPDGLAVLAPYGLIPGAIAEIVVNNNGQLSNKVTAFVSKTSPGLFATPIPNGLGYVAARHTTRPDQGVVSAADRALPGEWLAVFLTGLGAVDPPVTAGQVGPLTPLSWTTAPFKVMVDGKEAESNFAGIAPLLRGAYQLNVKVPVNADDPGGALVLEIDGPDSRNFQIKIPGQIGHLY